MHGPTSKTLGDSELTSLNERKWLCLQLAFLLGMLLSMLLICFVNVMMANRYEVLNAINYTIRLHVHRIPYDRRATKAISVRPVGLNFDKLRDSFSGRFFILFIQHIILAF